MKEKNLPMIRHSSLYADWFADRVTEFSKAQKGRFETTDLYLSQNAFLVTFMFDQTRIRRRYATTEGVPSKGAFEFRNHDHFYNLLCRSLLGRHYVQADPASKPLVIACLDAKGSRYWRSMGEVSNLHIHAIYVFPKGTCWALSKLRDEALSGSSADRLFDFSHIDIEPFNAKEGYRRSLARISSYASKFVGFNESRADISDDLKIYPINRSPNPTATGLASYRDRVN